jgi:hypothetical protein
MPSLRDFGHPSLQNHGLTPMATECRRFAANRNLANRNLANRNLVRRNLVRRNLVNRYLVGRIRKFLIILIQLNQFLPSFDLFRNSVWIT